MQYVAIVERVNQKCNQDLVGQIIIVDPELEMSFDGELCYRQEPTYSIDTKNVNHWGRVIGLLHSVSNIEIIGIL